MRTQWLSSWLKVRDKLEKVTQHPDRLKQFFQIDYNQYQKICQKEKVEEEEEIQMLSQYLHDLGIILHFQKDLILKDSVIIKPEWGTYAVYKILDSKVVQKRQGILLREDLPKIWSDSIFYPSNRYPVLLRLMSRFELAFPLVEGEKYMVSELLPIRPVKHTWEDTDQIQFEYHYEFLPAGVMTRFIVRTHEYLMEKDEKKLCWKEGAYLEKGENQAYTKITPIEKKVVIKVRGNQKREFLAIIRDHFDHIHKTLRKIRFHERIPCPCIPGCTGRFDYDFLLRAEQKKIPEVLCQVNLNQVSVSELLEGIESFDKRKERYPLDKRAQMILHMNPKIHVDPHIEVNPKIQVTSESHSQATTQIDFKGEFPNISLK